MNVRTMTTYHILLIFALLFFLSSLGPVNAKPSLTEEEIVLAEKAREIEERDDLVNLRGSSDVSEYESETFDPTLEESEENEYAASENSNEDADSEYEALEYEASETEYEYEASENDNEYEYS